MMPEIGFTLRTLLDDGDEFKVEFLYQINQDQPWSWIGKVTCNGENLTKKSIGIVNTRKHFPIPASPV